MMFLRYSWMRHLKPVSYTHLADSVNVQALNMGRIVVDVDGVNLSALINKVSENGSFLRVVDKYDQHATSTPPPLSLIHI